MHVVGILTQYRQGISVRFKFKPYCKKQCYESLYNQKKDQLENYQCFFKFLDS